MEVDYLIVGQGIAGSMLTHFLLQDQKNVVCVDDSKHYASSLVAAGLFNPITGRRIVKTWKADVLLPFAKKTYTELERLLKIQCYHEKNILKIFTSIKEQNDWYAKSSMPEFEKYIASNTPLDSKNKNIPCPFGSFEITQSGYVDLPLFLSRYKHYLEENECMINSPFLYSDLILTENGIQWKEIKAKKIIFCEGHNAVQNPFFKDLPFVLTKGELLSIYSKDLQLQKLVSKGIFILPLGEDKYKLGATYSWSDLSQDTTASARISLLEKLEKTISCPYEVIDHQAGIRPTVKDRRPFIGLHPQHSAIGIFNGMGTKGASLSPYFAQHFAAVLNNKEKLDPEVDIQRFY
jgi:glycine/D-amino acid oxidase-like deaminating enzyme